MAGLKTLKIEKERRKEVKTKDRIRSDKKKKYRDTRKQDK